MVTLRKHLGHTRRLASAIKQGQSYFHLLQKEEQEEQEEEERQRMRMEEQMRTEPRPHSFSSDSDSDSDRNQLVRRERSMTTQEEEPVSATFPPCPSLSDLPSAE